MLPSIITGLAVLFAVTWIAWRGLRLYAARESLAKVPGPKPKSWLKGNFEGLFEPDGWAFHEELASKYNGIALLKGFFGEPMLHVFDPEALHRIFVEDQNSYEEPESTFTLRSLVFGKGLLSTSGNHHLKQRKLLNPAFSNAHIREMIPIFYDVVHKTRDAILPQVSDGQKEIDMSSWMTRTALELIGQSGLGHSFDPLTEDAVEHPFATSLKNFIRVVNSFTISRFLILPWAVHIGSAKFRRRVVDLCPWKKLHVLRDMVDVMHTTSVDILESKKRVLAAGDDAISEQIGKGKDIISILLRANLSASDQDRLPEEDLLAQISTLTFAAMDTTSNGLSRILHLLSQHQDVQDKLRKEVRDVLKDGGDLGYDDLVGLPYLDAVCRETLRLYPPVAFLIRQTRKDVVLPLSKSIVSPDGKELWEVFVPNDTLVFVSIIACNRNPDIWGPDAHEWRAERWLSPLPESVSEARIPGVYTNLMTFSGGSRACIGFKFSQLEMKVVLSLLLESFQFSPSDKEIFWRQNGIVQPTVKEGSEFRLQLPLKVSLAP